jgi:hypothetical protein
MIMRDKRYEIVTYDTPILIPIENASGEDGITAGWSVVSNGTLALDTVTAVDGHSIRLTSVTSTGYVNSSIRMSMGLTPYSSYRVDCSVRATKLEGTGLQRRIYISLINLFGASFSQSVSADDAFLTMSLPFNSLNIGSFDFVFQGQMNNIAQPYTLWVDQLALYKTGGRQLL